MGLSAHARCSTYELLRMRDEFPEEFEGLMWDFLKGLEGDGGGWRRAGESIAAARDRILAERRAMASE